MADLGFRVNQVIKTEVDVTQAQLIAQRRGGDHRARQFSGRHARPRRELARPERSRSAHHHHHHRHQARRQRHRSAQRPHHRQQRPDSGHPGDSQDADRGGRRRHRRGIHVHVRHPGLARDSGGEAAAPAGIRRLRNGGGALLQPARPSRHHAPERRSRRRGRQGQGRRRGAHEEQQGHQRRCPAVRRRQAGQRGRAESRRRRPRSRQPRPHHRGRRVPHQGAEHFRRGRHHRLPQPGLGIDGTGPPGGGQRRGVEDPIQPGDLSLRDLYDSRNLLHRARPRSS